MKKLVVSEIDIVSGTIAGGTVTAASAEPTNSGSYGTFYPSLGVMLFNAERLAGGPLSIAHVTSSNNDARNNRKFFNAIVQGAYFQAKRREEISSRHIFIRAKADDFNSTTNETFFTESKAGIKQVISALSWCIDKCPCADGTYFAKKFSDFILSHPLPSNPHI